MNERWNLKILFSGDNDQNIAKAKQQIVVAGEKFINRWQKRQDYLSDSTVLAEALADYEAWQHSWAHGGSVWYYYWLRLAEDQNNPEIKARFNQIEEVANKLENDMRFFEHNLSNVPKIKQEELLNNENLRPYQYFLKRLFAWSPYLRQEESENLLNLLTPTSYSNWVKMVESFLSQEEARVLTEEGRVEKKSFSELLSLMESERQPVRERAARAFNKILKKHRPVAENELNSLLGYKKTIDNFRGFSRPDSQRHLNDDIDTEVVDALIKAVESRYDISQRFYTLKAKLLGLPKLKYHERNIAYDQSDKRYSYNQAVAIVTKVCQGLDSDFVKIFQEFVNKGQIDVFPRSGKHDGAFCISTLISEPVYILLNYNGRLRDVLTLAHELGHGINDEMMKKQRHALEYETSLATAEVASTFFEDFVLEEISREISDQERLVINMAKLNDEISTIFRQVAAYQFEQDLHQQFRTSGYLSSERIGQLFQQYMKSYMGPAVEQSPGSNNWWIYWSHFRRFFYVYSYASGLIISKSLQSRIRQDHTFIKEIKQFLTAGRSASPLQIFQDLNIDIKNGSFWLNGLNQVDQMLTESENLARRLKKIS